MTKKDELKWQQLRVGIMVVTAAVILTVGITMITGSKQLFKQKTTLFARLPQVDGLKSGALVRLAGVDIGSVHKVSFSNGSAGTTVLVEMRINEEFAAHIHKDAIARLGTIGLLGDKYIEILPGSPARSRVEPGSILPGEAPSPLEDFSAQAGSTLERLDHIAGRLDGLLTKLSEGQGSAARFINEPAIASSLVQVLEEAGDLLSTVNRSGGTLGRLTKDEALAENLFGFISSANAIGKAVVEGEGTVGRLASDTTLYVQLSSVSTRLDHFLAEAQEGDGLLAAFLHDEQLRTEVVGLVSDLRSLVRDVQENPGRYFKVSVF